MRTEAGKRLLAKVNAEPPLGCLSPEDVDAIEVEAVAQAYGSASEGRLQRDFDLINEAVAAERDRIVAEIRRSLYHNPNGRADAYNQGLKCALAIVKQES